jgi:hypothetical protein
MSAYVIWRKNTKKGRAKARELKEKGKTGKKSKVRKKATRAL